MTLTLITENNLKRRIFISQSNEPPLPPEDSDGDGDSRRPPMLLINYNSGNYLSHTSSIITDVDIMDNELGFSLRNFLLMALFTIHLV